MQRRSGLQSIRPPSPCTSGSHHPQACRAADNGLRHAQRQLHHDNALLAGQHCHRGHPGGPGGLESSWRRAPWRRAPWRRAPWRRAPWRRASWRRASWRRASWRMYRILHSCGRARVRIPPCSWCRVQLVLQPQQRCCMLPAGSQHRRHTQPRECLLHCACDGASRRHSQSTRWARRRQRVPSANCRTARTGASSASPPLFSCNQAVLLGPCWLQCVAPVCHGL